MKKSKKNLKNNFIKRIFVGVVTTVIALTGATSYASNTKPVNPVSVSDSSLQAGKKVTYDCIFFGSYPQAEIVPNVQSETTVDPIIRNGNDYIVDSTTYNKLKTATNWDSNSDITLEDGSKYRRLKYDEATYYTQISDNYVLRGHYKWAGNLPEEEYFQTNKNDYHYFKYQPIKWRVLNVSDQEAFLMSDIILDTQKYNSTRTDVTWETSTIRSFLNSYNGSQNGQNIDYSGKGFFETAFTKTEAASIKTTTVVNNDNKKQGTEGGNNTADKIFLLSEDEICTTAYGFISTANNDEARQVTTSTYAKAMGAYTNMDLTNEFDGSKTTGSSFWWLRSPGASPTLALSVITPGWLDSYPVNGDSRIYSCGLNDEGEHIGTYLSSDSWGTRPALKLDLSLTNLYSSAGTVNSGDSLVINYDSAHTHNYSAKITKTATCATFGIKTYTCSTCGDTYYDTITNPENHSYDTEKIIKKPSYTTKGEKQITCSLCGDNYKESINKLIATPLKSVKFKKATYEYTGKAIKPSIQVYDKNKKTVSSKNYTISLKNNTKVGKATIIIKGKNAYTGTLKSTFTIVPKRVTILSATSPKDRQITIKWKKNTSVTGYQIQYSTKSNFSKSYTKTLNISKNKITSTSLRKLNKKTNYYVRIRAYKKVSKKTYYSTWAKTKKIKTR